MHTQNFLKRITPGLIIRLIALMLGIIPVSGCGQLEGNVVYSTQTTAITKPDHIVYALNYIQGKLKPGAENPTWWSRATAVKNGQTLDGVVLDQLRVENGVVKATLRGFSRPSPYKDINIGDIPPTVERGANAGEIVFEAGINYMVQSLQNLSTNITVTFKASGWEVRTQYIVPFQSDYTPPVNGPTQAL